MKKVLVATCLVAMTAFGITHASAQTSVTVQDAQTARASAFGLELQSSLLGGGEGDDDALIPRTGEAESVLPPGGPEEDDILTVGNTGELLLSATGSVLADTRAEPTIQPILNPENEEGRGGGGEGSGLMGDDLIGGLLGGGDFLGGLIGGGDEGTVGGIAGLSEDEAGSVQAQQLGGGDDEGTIGGLLGGGDEGFLGGLGGLLDSGDDEEGNLDPDILFPLANAQGYAVVEGLGVANEDSGSLVDRLDLAGLTETAAQALVDALLKVEAVQAEAVVLCTNAGPQYDTASRIVDVNNDNVELVDEIVNSVAELLPNVIDVNETGRTADGGVFVNALHVTVGGDLLDMEDDDTSTTSSTTSSTVAGASTESVADALEDVAGTSSPGDVQIQQIGDGDDALIDLVVGHAEVSGATVCAQQDDGGVAPLPPAGDDRTLPATGGGLGVLPAVLALGLAGGALAAGRVAMRSRREHTL